jgi:hypothetical protein
MPFILYGQRAQNVIFLDLGARNSDSGHRTLKKESFLHRIAKIQGMLTNNIMYQSR